MRLHARSLAAAVVVGAGLLLASPALAWADPTGSSLKPKTPGQLTGTEFGLNLLWVVVAAVLVIFMQAGFAMVETGFCRARHAAHVVSTNFAIFGLGFVAFFAVGYAFMFGGVSAPVIGYAKPLGAMLGFGAHGGLLGHTGFFLAGPAYDVSVAAFFLYMVAFMDTTATIPTGAMAERWKFSSFTLWGLFCGAIFYPLYGAWVWGGGWLSQLGNSLGLGHGVVDFAGSGVVHAMGGVAALAGAIVLGPRIGKYGPDGKPRTIAGHHIPMAMLGTFILLVGWFGFNAGSTLAATDLRFTVVATNTAIAAAFGATVAMYYIRARTGKFDPGMMANGMLAGLVAITAPCAFVQPWAAAVIGSVAAVLVVHSIWFFERRAKVDDPVGAISVHGTCGLWGVLTVGLFADGSYGDGFNGVSGGVKGLLYGGADQLAAQVVSVLVISLVMFGIALAFFKAQHVLTQGGIRPAGQDELAGLDLPEMGARGYADFVLAPSGAAEPSGDGDGQVHRVPSPADPVASS